MRFKSAVAAVVLASAAAVGMTGMAHANVYQRNVRLINRHDGTCLDSNDSGDLYVGGCNARAYQRWNVLSYNTDVDHYYARVQVQNVKTGKCLRIDREHQWNDQPWDPIHYPAHAGSCDSGDWHDQWNLIWVGNTAPNQPNSWQFANYQQNGDGPKILCLDRGQQGHWNNMMFDLGAPAATGGPARYTCNNHTNTYQIWAMAAN